jgi:hypothetical protein
MLSEMIQTHLQKSHFTLLSWVDLGKKTKGQESQRGTNGEAERRGERGKKKGSRGVNLIKVHCMHAWKRHGETPWYCE